MQIFTTVLYVYMLGLLFGLVEENVDASRSAPSPYPPGPQIYWADREPSDRPATLRGLSNFPHSFCCIPAFNGFRPPPSFRHAPVPSLKKRIRDNKGRSASRSPPGNTARVSSGNVQRTPDISFGMERGGANGNTVQRSPSLQGNSGFSPQVAIRPPPPLSPYYILHRDQANSDNGLRRRLPPRYIPGPSRDDSGLTSAGNVRIRPEAASGTGRGSQIDNTVQRPSNAPISAGSANVLPVRTKPPPPVSPYYILHRDQANNDNGLRRRLPPYYTSSDHSGTVPRSMLGNSVPATPEFENDPSPTETFTGEYRTPPSDDNSHNTVQRSLSPPLSSGSASITRVRAGPLPPVSGFYVLHRNQANSDNGLRRRLPPYYVPSDKQVETGKSSAVDKAGAPQNPGDNTVPQGAKPAASVGAPKAVELPAPQKASDTGDNDRQVPVPRSSQNDFKDAADTRSRKPVVKIRPPPEPQAVVQRHGSEASKEPRQLQLSNDPSLTPEITSGDQKRKTSAVDTHFKMSSPEAVNEMNELIRTRPKDAQKILSRVSAQDLASLIAAGSRQRKDERRIVSARG